MLKENLNQEVKLINYGENPSDYSLTKSVVKTTIGKVLERFNIEILTKEELLERNRPYFEEVKNYNKKCGTLEEGRVLDLEDHCITKYMCDELDTEEWFVVANSHFAYRVNQKYIKDINKALRVCEGMVFSLSGRRPRYKVEW